jgi:hypothetical protein
MSLDPRFQLMLNGTQRQIILQVSEGGFHLCELDVKLPQFSVKTKAP